jgi:1-acyl-sn-glycerol-3-phosphate acyltransferase
MPYSLKLSLIGLLSTATGIVLIALGPFDRTGRLANRFVTYWAWGILKIGGIRISVHGLERLDPHRHYIFIANHQSYIDIPTMIQALPGFQLRWIAKKELLRIPIFGWAMWSAKHIVVDRFNLAKARASLRKAQKRIKEGVSVVIFPEGTRSSHRELLPFKKGGFVLALKTQVPVVPVTIIGSANIWPRSDWRVKKGKIDVIVSEPKSMNQYRVGNIQELTKSVRTEIESQRQSPLPFPGDSTTDAQAGGTVSPLTKE